MQGMGLDGLEASWRYFGEVISIPEERDCISAKPFGDHNYLYEL